MRKRCEFTRKSLSIKKPNEMRSILLKGFGYAPRRNLGRRRNTMKPAVLKKSWKGLGTPACWEDVLSKAKNGSPEKELKGFGYAPRRSLGRRRNTMKPAVLKKSWKGLGKPNY
jgi:ribosomal protein S6E (S10)